MKNSIIKNNNKIMKYIKIYEDFMNFNNSEVNSGIAADLEASDMGKEEAWNSMDSGMEESQFGAEEVLARWEQTFGEKEPTKQEKYDFYADLREEGFDGILIFDTLGAKMGDSDIESDVCCDTCSCTPCECPTNDEECVACTDDNCCAECKCDPCEC